MRKPDGIKLFINGRRVSVFKYVIFEHAVSDIFNSSFEISISIDGRSPLAQLMALCGQATSYYLRHRAIMTSF